MKRFIQAVLGIVGTLVVAVLLFMAYVTWTPKLIGLESAVEDVCAAVEVGASSAELDAQIAAHDAFNLVALTTTSGTAFINKQQGEFLCMCGVNIANDRVASVDEPFCVD